MRPLCFHYALVAATCACAAPGPGSTAPHHAVLPAPVPSACDVERQQARAHRDQGFWLRAAQELEASLNRCPQQRPENEAALVELVIGLEDGSSAERLLPTLTERSHTRLGAWLQTWRAKPTSPPLATASAVRAVRAARAQRAANALELAETALARGGARCEKERAPARSAVDDEESARLDDPGQVEELIALPQRRLAAPFGGALQDRDAVTDGVDHLRATSNELLRWKGVGESLLCARTPSACAISAGDRSVSR